ncbi:NADH dehydrogenase [ubiquinone] 1 beta subcomplex subunit 11, mitochondrial [Dermacentor andersoni]|uniref:NADH dehydrogenase [ubiquinone] 1 beta subcomplex subunit 11, mitochondrial n=1 Tax=Dermacentor andersoni TaxID=34620 RepID=UPI002155714A|nr:NADH dehydrogenase [ubiquinone] 1 beta subcomplex subunit 11, mitochondrial-like [Dermacentor andersoni]
MALLLRRNLLPRLAKLHKVTRLASASISTTPKNKEVPTATVPDTVGKPPVTAADFADTKPRYWISYGYSTEDYHEDSDAHHTIMFTGLSLVVCGAVIAFAYAPDFKNVDWIEREAHLELERREKLGLPLVDPNLIDPSRIVLPSDEELGDFEIVL